MPSAVLHTIVDSHLRVPTSGIDDDILRVITDELTLPNKEREYAEATKKYGWWDLPEYFELFDIVGGELIMPRGYALQFKLLMREQDVRVRWHHKTKYRRGKPYGKDEFEYLVHQPAAVRQMRRHWQGIYQAPTGSGKTVTVCGYLWETHPKKALILVERKSLVKQWKTRIHQHIGDVTVGTISEGKRSDGRIVVATMQACHSAIKNDEDWIFDLLESREKAADVIVVDECHHAPADSYRKIVDRSIAMVRLGVSATPKKGGKIEVAHAVLGEIIHEDSDQELKEAGIIGDPTIQVIKTPFEFGYWGDHQSDDDGDCQVPGCKRFGPHRHRSNYQKAKQALVASPERNMLIAEQIIDVRQWDDGPHHQLVITNEVKQLEAIRAALSSQGVKDSDIFVLKGKMTEKTQQEIIDKIESQDESITLSTIAGEGLDIPVLDVGHLVFPTGDPEKTKQEIGRFRRGQGGVIFDYADTKVKVFAKHFRNRRYQCYDALDLEVVMND